MGKDQYLLYHPKFKKYVAFDPDSKPIFVFNPDKAKFFTHAAASNFMQKNAFGEFKFCNIIPCGGNVRQMLADASNTSVARNDLFQKLMDTLEDKVRNYDAQMVALPLCWQQPETYSTKSIQGLRKTVCYRSGTLKGESSNSGHS